MRRWFRIFLCATGILLCLHSHTGAQSVKENTWGYLPDDRKVLLFTLDSGNGVSVQISNYGALLHRLECPDRNGKQQNIILSHRSFDEALKGGVLGSIIGRFANRIDRGGFTIDGTFYALESVNKKTNVHIHGGKNGFHRQLWEVTSSGSSGDETYIELSLTSPDGEEGYPGEVTARVRYTLSQENKLRLDYFGKTSRPTHLNLTNHAYFNLSGEGDVSSHELQLNTDRILEFDDRKIPTGKLLSVKGTPFDFITPRKLKERINQTPERGFDHYFALPTESGIPTKRKLAVLSDPISGRKMVITTTKPGAQIYTANHFSGNPFPKWGGICFETQYFPDTPNHEDFPTSLLRPGKSYQHSTTFQFHVEP